MIYKVKICIYVTELQVVINAMKKKQDERMDSERMLFLSGYHRGYL